MAEQIKSSVGNINSRLPPEMLCNVFHFLPFSDLKEALLVCRSVSSKWVTNSCLQLFFSRQWREVGEQPSLWAKLKLKFDGEKPFVLGQVLTLGRLQSLESISLGCWGQLRNHLQTVVHCCPKLRKLAVDFDQLWILANMGPLPEEELTGVAEMFVKFEDVDLTKGFNLFDTGTILRAILRALPEDRSKLKILTIHGDEKKHTAVLLEAKNAGITVNMQTNGDGDSDNSIDINDLLDNDNGNDSDFEDYE